MAPVSTVRRMAWSQLPYDVCEAVAARLATHDTYCTVILPYILVYHTPTRVHTTIHSHTHASTHPRAPPSCRLAALVRGGGSIDRSGLPGWWDGLGPTDGLGARATATAS